VTNPLTDLEPRLVRRDAEVTAAEAAGDRLGNVRLALAAVTLVLVLLPLYTRDGRPWWALLPVAVVFVVLGALHARASEREARARAARAYWQAEKDRVQEKWRELPDQGRDLLPSATTFDARVGLAGDLDLFGPASLYQLLSRAVTPRGRQTLAAWLLEPAAPAEIRARQEAVRELAAKPELREALAVAARMGAEVKLSETGLLAWGESPRPLRFGAVLRIVALLETAALLTTAGLWLALGMPEPFVVALIVQVATLLAIRGPVMERAGRINSPDRALMRFAELLAVIETTTVTSARLLDARTRLATEGVPASQRLASLRGLVERLEASGNMFFAVTLGPALFWDLHLVLAAERWQLQVGPKLRGWLEVIGEVEALASLGAFLAVRPDASMPELVDGEGVYEVHGLSHPLLDRTRAVANDVTLGGPGSVLLLSGSNMSGKSTFLRAIGLSCVLAQAGGPVTARKLRLSPVVLATSIRVVDSLAQGASHFYAELQRIKFVQDTARVLPSAARLMYLLDEMLHGTNSKERFIGAVAVVRWLAQRGAVGVVTTHDLSLAQVADELPAGRVVNRHFGDEVDGERIRFDYVLKPGAVQSTNALRLMRAIGIDLDERASVPPPSAPS
jgi:hypothetical protein